MKPSHPPISTGNFPRKKDGPLLPAHIKKALNDKFARYAAQAPKEALTTHRMGGFGVGEGGVVVVWQPHNFRRYYSFDRIGFVSKKPSTHTLQEMQGVVPNFQCNYFHKTTNSGAEEIYDDFMGCQIRVKRRCVEVVNKWHHKQWRKTLAVSLDAIGPNIDRVLRDMEEQCLHALRVFITLHGGRSDFGEFRSGTQEIGLEDEEFLRRVDPGCIVHDPVFKKVYGEKFEFKTPLAVKNYVHNRALEKLSPEISSRLDALCVSLDLLSRPVRMADCLARLQGGINSFPVDLLLPENQFLLRELDLSHKLLFSEWLFVRFGGVC